MKSAGDGRGRDPQAICTRFDNHATQVKGGEFHGCYIFHSNSRRLDGSRNAVNSDGSWELTFVTFNGVKDAVGFGRPLALLRGPI